MSLMVETRLFCGLGRKTLTSPGKVQMTKLVTASYQTLESDGRNKTFSRSQPEDADISGKGADDEVSHCELPDP